MGMRSRHRCDTLSGRVPGRIGEGVERIEGEIWRRLEETAIKSGGEGEEQQLSAAASPSHGECISNGQEEPAR